MFNSFLVMYFVAVAMMSPVSFAAYGLDKRRAAAGQRRIPEQRLHLLAFLGGWPGAIAGRRAFRHKTQKLRFRIVSWLVLILHLGIVGTVGFLLFTFG